MRFPFGIFPFKKKKSSGTTKFPNTHQNHYKKKFVRTIFFLHKCQKFDKFF